MFLNEWEVYSDRYNEDGTDKEDLDRPLSDAETSCLICGERVVKADAVTVEGDDYCLACDSEVREQEREEVTSHG